MPDVDRGAERGEKPCRAIQVMFNGETITAQHGATVAELLRDHPHAGPLPPLGALVSYRLTGLHYELVSDCTVQTVDYASKGGASIYRRTATVILLEAITELFPGARAEVGQSVGHGYFFKISMPDDHPLTDADVDRIRARMTEIVQRDLPLVPIRIAVEEAIEEFQHSGYPEKARLLQTLPHSKIWWIDLGVYRDILHGPLAASTGVVSVFALEAYEHGAILRFPDVKFQMRPSRGRQDKLFTVFRETRAWNQEIGIHNVADLNSAVLRDETAEIIRVVEGFQEKKIASIADQIEAEHGKIRLVLVAGPSSSGKTTFTKRLAVQLRVNGLRPVALSMDNYYVDREKTPRNPDGTYNFESLDALDVDYLNDDLARLMNGDEVATPIFSFTEGKRRADKALPLRLEPDHVLVMEGIHCLNERISRAVARDAKFKIYVSALTQLIIDSHSRIFTSDSRLIRRLVRDRLFRGYSAEQTITQWPSVRAGENRYIFPYQEEADVMFNSALVYETSVLKTYAQRFLLTVTRNTPAYTEAHRLLAFLDYFVPIFPEEVPQNSLLREFIGGSTFTY
ncbi:MAG: nucleoside kinase [Candidatus Eisenbacteria bacterium]|jgi:uridine kinase|nr:nucleoside kinase [Candidatus Eisenbacteria bacterium]